MVVKLKRMSFWLLTALLLTAAAWMSLPAQAAWTASDMPPAGLTAAEWESIQTSIAEAEYRFAYREGTGDYYAPNRAHGWQTSFNAEGVHVTPGEGNWAWSLRLTGYGYADDLSGFQDLSSLAPVMSAKDDTLTYHWDSTLTEWWINDPDGLEQGFTLLERPGAANGHPLTLEMAVTSDLTAVPDGDGIAFVGAAGFVVLTYDQLHVTDATGQVIPAQLALSPGGGLRVQIDDAHAVYPLTIDPWLQSAKLTPSAGWGYANFGRSIAIDGDTLVVGAGDSSGRVYIYVKPATGGWADATETALITADMSAGNSSFGWSVAIDGDTLVVGDPLYGTCSGGGAVYIFEKPAGGWADLDGKNGADATATLDSGLDPCGNNGQSHFGWSVAIEGDTVVVGDEPDGNLMNQVELWARVFVKPGTGWTDTSIPNATLSPGLNMFYGAGSAVAIGGDTIVLSDPELANVDGLAAYIFVKPTGGWANTSAPDATLTPTDNMFQPDPVGDPGFWMPSPSKFGTSVVIDDSGDTVVVGAPERDLLGDTGGHANRGGAYVFEKGTGWSGGTAITTTETAMLTRDTGDDGARLGQSLAFAGDMIVAGAPANEWSTLAGAVYLYEKPDTGWASTNTPTDGMTPSDSAAADQFGYAVAAVPNFAAATRPGDFDDEDAAAYIFDAPPTPPELMAYTPITNTITAPLDSSVVLTYSAEMSETTITSRTVALHSMMHGLVADATRSVGGANNTVVTINPAGDFFPGELVYAIPTTGTTDITGTHAIAGPQWQFNAAVTAGWGNFDETPINFGTGTDKTWSVAWGDVDGDGDLDLAVGNYGNQNAVYLNNGDGTLDNDNPITFGVAPAGYSNDYTYSVAWGDFDNDGDLDLAAGNALQSAVYLNNGDNTFDNDNPINFGGSTDVTRSVAWGDFDNDGDLDLAAGTIDEFGSSNKSAVYLNNGDGTLDATTPITFGGGDESIQSVAWGDVDNDGDLDLAVGIGFVGVSRQDVVYLNNGDGTLDNAHPVTFGGSTDNTYSVAWGDFDNDGNLDIAAGNDSGRPSAVYLNNGDGTFDNAHPVTFGGSTDATYSVAFGDFNNDGKLDIAASNDVSSQSAVYLNNGDGTFDNTNPIAFGEFTEFTKSAAWGDFDNDGDLDLAMGNEGNSSGEQNAVYLNAPPLPDVTLSKSVSPAFAQPGDSITYTLIFYNAGGATAAGVVVTDRVPVSVTNTSVISSGVAITQQVGARYVWDVADLAPGAGGVITITGVLSNPLALGSFSNMATITTTAADSDPDNNTRSASVTVVDTTPPATPTGLQPADQTITSTHQITLSWGTVSDAVSYTVEVSGTLYVVDAPTTTLPLTFPTGPYTWTVTAYDGAGNPSAPGAPQSFAVTGAPVNRTLNGPFTAGVPIPFGAGICGSITFTDTVPASFTITYTYDFPSVNHGGLLGQYEITVAGGGSYEAALTLCYDDADLPVAGMDATDEPDLVGYGYASPAWSPYPSVVDTGGNTVTLHGVTQFGFFGLGIGTDYPTVVTLRTFATRGSAWAFAGAALFALGGVVVVRRKRR